MSPSPTDELLPWWMERRIGPTGSDPIPGPAAATNTDDRNWTTLGTVGAGGRASVDPRGLVSPQGAGWSLDWWAGADDQWHAASNAALVRQSLVESTPVLLTSMRIPGGELEQRAWAVADPGSGGGVLVIELRNESPVPVAVAFSVRPFDLDGRTSINSIDVHDNEVHVGGRLAFVASKAPSRFAVGSAALGDSYEATVSGSATTEWPAGGVHCDAGRASVALIFPLPHTASIRVAIPLGNDAGAARGSRSIDVASLPDSERVAGGWRSQTARAPRFDVPERRIGDATAAARCHLLMHAAGEDPVRWPGVPVDGSDRAEIAMALDENGFHAESTRVLRSALDLQGANGSFDDGRLDATAGWLVAAGRHTSLSGDTSLAACAVGPIAAAAHWLHRRQVGNRLRRSTAFFGAGAGPVGAGTASTQAAHDAEWTARAYGAASSMLRIVDQIDAAAEIDRYATRLAAEMRVRGIDPNDGPVPSSLAEDGTDTVRPRDVATYARACVASGDIEGFPLLHRLLDIGDPTWTWPSIVDSRGRGVDTGDGHDPAATAAFLRLVRALLVVELPDGLSLLPAVPPSWLGRPIEAHDLPTAFGTLSFALRWHGARPALLWELESHDQTTAVLSAPGLDRAWTSVELRGEALLSEPLIDASFIAAPEPEPEPEPTVDRVERIAIPGTVADLPPDGGGSFS